MAKKKKFVWVAGEHIESDSVIVLGVSENATIGSAMCMAHEMKMDKVITYRGISGSEELGPLVSIKIDDDCVRLFHSNHINGLSEPVKEDDGEWAYELIRCEVCTLQALMEAKDGNQT